MPDEWWELVKLVVNLMLLVAMLLQRRPRP
jgi:hypothetical protein